MARRALFVLIALCMAALTSGVLQRRFKRQSDVAAASDVVSAMGAVDKADLEALKVNIVQKFLLAVLFSAQNDEKRTNETKVRVTRFPLNFTSFSFWVLVFITVSVCVAPINITTVEHSMILLIYTFDLYNFFYSHFQRFTRIFM